MRKRVLIVEDDVSIASLLKDNLEFEDFEVRCAGDGLQALRLAKSFEPDLVLLDLMLPDLGGFDVCRALHRDHPDVAVVILTVKDAKEDKIRGLEPGADDYVTKPFDLGELLARLHAVLRRANRPADLLVLGETVVDFARFRAERSAVEIPLTQRELDLLRYLADHANRVVSREELLRGVWGYSETSTTRTVDNFVARLRRKIERDPRHPEFLHTAYGNGYRLTTRPSDVAAVALPGPHRE